MWLDLLLILLAVSPFGRLGAASAGRSLKARLTGSMKCGLCAFGPALSSAS